jgi:SAM-dependent methyltransferase
MEYTGERIIPRIDGKMYQRHVKAYKFGMELIKRYSDRTAKILDYGCGEGYGSYLLASTGCRVVGADISDLAIQEAKVKYPLPNLKFCKIDEIEAESYDFIVCFQVIEHINKPEVIIATLVQRLKKQGTLVITTPNRKTNQDIGLVSPYHIKEYSSGEMRAMLEKRLEIDNTLGLMGNHRVSLSRFFDRWQNIIDKRDDSILTKVAGYFLYFCWKYIAPNKYAERDFIFTAGNIDKSLDLVFVCRKTVD